MRRASLPSPSRRQIAMESLETERLRLRPWRESDFDSVAWYYADEDNARYLEGGHARGKVVITV